MYKIQYNPTENRVDIIIIEINKDNVDNYIADYIKVLECVKPGFIGMADLSEGQLFTKEICEKLDPLSQVTVGKGLRKWANYATPEIKLQMDRMYGEVADTFVTREEAEAFLKE
ncbi:hypothetical protein [Paenibacillus popilliae]|uniref:Uncharacterized protein conserved in bacteria n=1 Tax=Paenibacillus popilliae ATCC 14706 TaxID=1212764 RepID=M9LM09_PAEPP|nr:hypothetical protein [Paenibacillus popilliae]GAC41121.1 uncharacterized protein conserved in bacteria [Paenibacillus popilliae ATCC 14706]